MDMGGQVMFGRTTTMTADGPMEFNLYRLHHDKWSNHDVELETGSGGIIPVVYRRKNLVNSIMWAIGLELALLTKSPWQCCSRRTTRTVRRSSSTRRSSLS